MLEIREARRSFGGVYAVDGVSLRIEPGQVHAVIGPNGAGKSTLFNLVIGQIPLQTGEIHYKNQRIDKTAPHKRAKDGIAIVFQGARVFKGMTVLENVMVGAHPWTKHGMWDAALRLPGHKREEKEIASQAMDALERVGLLEFSDADAGSVPLGHQRRLQVARALCSRPDLLLLDEPASGLRVEERRVLAELIEELHGQGIAVMLVEHDVAFVSRLADTMTVLDLGRVIASGPPAEVFKDPRVIAAYIGEVATSD
ncbi:ABC transporter ATP-binding protein [Pseudarthrobacter oxydans]|uniref:ABC transporter ATP-binding protein n=1 Tax=Pseudarthrobacter oxydans TaxID=1671 RepID=UPI00380AA30D